jgi:hypothetical protein
MASCSSVNENRIFDNSLKVITIRAPVVFVFLKLKFLRRHMQR